MVRCLDPLEHARLVIDANTLVSVAGDLALIADLACIPRRTARLADSVLAIRGCDALCPGRITGLSAARPGHTHFIAVGPGIIAGAGALSFGVTFFPFAGEALADELVEIAVQIATATAEQTALALLHRIRRAPAIGLTVRTEDAFEV